MALVRMIASGIYRSSSDMQAVALQRPHAVGTTDYVIKRNSFLELLLDK
jgi:hypothetical protein